MYYVEILSGLWIGDSEIMAKAEFIRDNQIDVVINCTDIFEFPNIDLLKVRIPFQAHAQSHENIAALQRNHSKITDLISEHIDHRNILIGCADGKCIAPLIVAIYILKHGHINHKSIYEMLLTKDSQLSLWCDLTIFT